jgi:hypothetical protein
MIKFADLPPDMQTLISDFVTAPIGDKAIPQFLPTREVRIADLPVVPLDEYDRGTRYARNMKPSETPPIIIADGQFLDGKHRRFSFQELGLETVTAIDLTGIAHPKMVAICSMGELGAGIEYPNTYYEYPDFPHFLVWDYKALAFATKNNGFTPYADEAVELSWNEVNARYSNPTDYLIFRDEYFDDRKATLRIERGTANQLIHGNSGWAWQLDHEGSLGGDWYDCESAEVGMQAAEAYVRSLLAGARVPQPELLMAVRSPEVIDLMVIPQSTSGRNYTTEASVGF